MQPPNRPIPYPYRSKISEHVQMLRNEGVITDIDHIKITKIIEADHAN